ncbi:peptidase inhibitor [Streptomyces sp. 150FB]|uniref:peptidase inhibitor family I36 protein n=1 Tax=Streptomyces sp. 150FB TaxID=1576605 RepID=UPI000588EBF8|nr:peptidase inhibitor family I36 protein [Streptomyces sp. 150FB]KIF79515.1 peptidase inhibitor [Streptomyces sp. 150FB]
MRSLRATVVFLAAAGALAAGLAPASARSAEAAYTCSDGYFCMYSGWNGTGTRCQYSQRVNNTADRCSFIRNGENVLSVYNRNSHKATYYTQTNYNGRIGSTGSGGRGSLQGNYQIRSISF